MSTIEEIATRAVRTRHYSPSELFAYLLGWLDSLNASLATDAELEQFHADSRAAYRKGVEGQQEASTVIVPAEQVVVIGSEGWRERAAVIALIYGNVYYRQAVT